VIGKKMLHGKREGEDDITVVSFILKFSSGKNVLVNLNY